MWARVAVRATAIKQQRAAYDLNQGCATAFCHGRGEFVPISRCIFAEPQLEQLMLI